MSSFKGLFLKQMSRFGGEVLPHKRARNPFLPEESLRTCEGGRSLAWHQSPLRSE